MSLPAENPLLQVILSLLLLLLDVELIKNNAKLGAEIAVSLAQKLAEETKSAEIHKSPAIAGTKITIVGGAAIDIIA